MPDTLMLRAPWTNTSNSALVSLRILRISSNVSSLARTTRAKPISSKAFTPAALWTDIWVEATNGRSGQMVFSTFTTARSWTMTPSGPAAATSRAAVRKAGSSSSRMRVLRVTYTFTPRPWQ